MGTLFVPSIVVRAQIAYANISVGNTVAMVVFHALAATNYRVSQSSTAAMTYPKGHEPCFFPKDFGEVTALQVHKPSVQAELHDKDLQHLVQPVWIVDQGIIGDDGNRQNGGRELRPTRQRFVRQRVRDVRRTWLGFIREQVRDVVG